MVLAVDFSVPGEQGAQFSRAFDRFEKGVTDLSEPFREIGKTFRRSLSKQFSTEGGHRSGGWEKLKQGYAKRKARKYPGRPILVATGEMKKALTVDGSLGNRSAITKLRAEFGLDSHRLLKRAQYHQLGTSRMSKRPIIKLNEADRRRWGRIIQGHLVMVAKRAEEQAGV